VIIKLPLPINFFLKNETVILKEFFEDLIITSNGGGIVGSEKISLSYQFLDFDFFLVGGGQILKNVALVFFSLFFNSGYMPFQKTSMIFFFSIFSAFLSLSPFFRLL